LYHAAYDDSTLKAEAYEVICEHASGRARDRMKEIAAEVESAIEADYDATTDAASYRGQ
jgi:hypothetical protein